MSSGRLCCPGKYKTRLDYLLPSWPAVDSGKFARAAQGLRVDVTPCTSTSGHESYDSPSPSSSGVAHAGASVAEDVPATGLVPSKKEMSQAWRSVVQGLAGLCLRLLR